MSLADDLARLDQLRRDGALTAEEFADAKRLLLHGSAPDMPAYLSGELDRSATEFFERENRSSRYLAVWNIVIAIVIVAAVVVGIVSLNESSGPSDGSNCTLNQGHVSCR